MAALTRQEFVAALDALKNDQPIDDQTRRSVHGMLLAAAANEGRSEGLRIARAYQANFAVGKVGPDLRLRPIELSSFLRLDLGDGGPLLTQQQHGLITAIIKVEPKLLDRLDLAAIDAAAKVSSAKNVTVRVNLKVNGASDRIAAALAAHPEATLIGEVVLGDRRPPTPEQLVEAARAIERSSSGFALSNVVDAKQLRDALDTLRDAGLKPTSADLHFRIGAYLGLPDADGEQAYENVKAMLEVAKEHEVDVSILAVAVGTKEARRALFSAAIEAGYPISDLHLGGRDLMAETTDIGVLPTPVVNRDTGAVVSL